MNTKKGQRMLKETIFKTWCTVVRHIHLLRRVMETPTPNPHTLKFCNHSYLLGGSFKEDIFQNPF